MVVLFEIHGRFKGHFLHQLRVYFNVDSVVRIDFGHYLTAAGWFY